MRPARLSSNEIGGPLFWIAASREGFPSHGSLLIVGYGLLCPISRCNRARRASPETGRDIGASALYSDGPLLFGGLWVPIVLLPRLALTLDDFLQGLKGCQAATDASQIMAAALVRPRYRGAPMKQG